MELFDFLPPFNQTKLSKEDVMKLKAISTKTPIPKAIVTHSFYVYIMDRNILKNKNLDNEPELRLFLLDCPSFTMMMIMLVVGFPTVLLHDYDAMLASRIDEVYKTKSIKAELAFLKRYLQVAREKLLSDTQTVYKFTCAWRRSLWIDKITDTTPLSSLRPFAAFVPIKVRVMALFLQRLYGTHQIDFPKALLPAQKLEQIGVWEAVCMMPATLPLGMWPLFDEFVRRVPFSGAQPLPALLSTYFTGWETLWKRHPDRWCRMGRRELALFRMDHPKLTTEQTRTLTNAVLSLAEHDHSHRTCA